MAGGSQSSGMRQMGRKRFSPTVGKAVSSRIGAKGQVRGKGTRVRRSSATGWR